MSRGVWGVARRRLLSRLSWGLGLVSSGGCRIGLVTVWLLAAVAEKTVNVISLRFRLFQILRDLRFLSLSQHQLRLSLGLLNNCGGMLDHRVLVDIFFHVMVRVLLIFVVDRGLIHSRCLSVSLDLVLSIIFWDSREASILPYNGLMIRELELYSHKVRVTLTQLLICPVASYESLSINLDNVIFL